MTTNVLLLTIVLSTARPPTVAVPWFGEDKLKHFFSSFVVTSMVASGSRFAGLDRHDSVLAGATAGALAGLYKEVHDARNGTGFSVGDLVWDLAGTGAAVGLVYASR